jgi:ChpA-C
MRKATLAVLATSAFFAFAPGVAQADTTGGNGGVLGGNQVQAPVGIPVNICGNAIAILGSADAHCQGGTSATAPKGHGATTHGGNQVNAPITAPINACGNAIGILGSSGSACRGGAHATTPGGTGNKTGGNGTGGLGGGNQINVPISAPVDACGNAVNATASCQGGSTVTGRHPRPPAPAPTPVRHHHVKKIAQPPVHFSAAANQLPFTGSPIETLLSYGGGAIVIGSGALLIARRRRQAQHR